MFQLFEHRCGHYLLLIATWALLCLVNLGAPSLWDQDEGLNAEAAREMLAAEDWVVPTFNYKLRSAKPALLYWAQMLCYKTFGVNEFSARLPSALAALFSVLLIYELGRRMFDPSTGLLAGIILGSSLMVCSSAHFANPDALLHFTTLLTFCIFWQSHSRGGNGWLAWCGIATGLGMLAKGPIGLCFPLATIGLFLLWSRQLRVWLHPLLLVGILLFIVVAVPWYAWVTAETKGLFLKEFILKDHLKRFNSPMESHSGPPFYYLLILCVGLAPWSIFFLFSGLHTWRHRNEGGASSCDQRYRFLLCWLAVYLIPFSIAATKLPNYVLPAYGSITLLIARALMRWRRGEFEPPRWILHLSWGSLAFIGVVTVFGGLIGGGVLLPKLTSGHAMPGLERWALLGTIPIAGSVLAWRFWNRQARQAVICSVVICSLVFVGGIAGFGALAVDENKAVRPLASALHREQPAGEIRVGSYDYFQPSLVFYCRRRVQQWHGEEQVLSFLQYDLPVLLFLPEPRWREIRTKSAVPIREVARHYSFERGCDVVLITNR